MSAKKTDSTIAQKLANFEALVVWFDSDDFELEKALEKYAQAEKLAGEIEKSLSAVKTKSKY